MVGNVEADSGVAELFGNEQKETAAAAKIENLLGAGPVQAQSPDPRKISFKPARDVSVLGILAGGRSGTLLNVAETFFIDLVQEPAGPE